MLQVLVQSSQLKATALFLGGFKSRLDRTQGTTGKEELNSEQLLSLKFREAASKDPQMRSEFFALTSAKDLISIPSPVDISSYYHLWLCKPGLGRQIYFYSLLWDLCCTSC